MEFPNPKAVFIVGPSSCGKTTLCDALAVQYGIPTSRHIKEVARMVMRTQGFTRDDVGTFEMQNAIMRAQLAAEQQARREEEGILSKASPILFLSDRSAVDPMVYAGMDETAESRGRESRLFRSTEFQEVIVFYQRSLFILLPFVKEWVVDDGVRSLESPEKYSNRMRKILKDFKIPFVEFGATICNLETRIAMVNEYLKVQSDLYNTKNT